MGSATMDQARNIDDSMAVDSGEQSKDEQTFMDHEDEAETNGEDQQTAVDEAVVEKAEDVIKDDGTKREDGYSGVTIGKPREAQNNGQPDDNTRNNESNEMDIDNPLPPDLDALSI